MPEPEAFNLFLIRLQRDEDLAPLIERLRPLRMSGILQSAVHIGNDLRILSATGRYPWEEANFKTPLPEDVRQRLRKASGVGAWNGGGALTGTAAHVRASRRAVRKAIGSLGKLVFVDDRKFALGEFAARCLNTVGLGKRLAAQLHALKFNYGLVKGIPADEPLIGTQWRLRHPPETGAADPLEHGCGIMWVSPVIPTTGRDAMNVLRIAEPIFQQFGFELLITFTLITERAMIVIINMAFDKSEAEETERAARCYDTLMDALIAAGCIPYRVGLHGLPKLLQPGDVFWDVASEIKRTLDPQDIIARGRYIPPLTPVSGRGKAK